MLPEGAGGCGPELLALSVCLMSYRVGSKGTDMRTCLAAISAGLILLAGHPATNPSPEPEPEPRATNNEPRAANTAQVTAQMVRTYPAAKQGGNYMHNYYFAPAPSSTPWAPAWSPDGSALAVAMSGSIWIVDRASGSARELTYNRKYHSMPDWSPDGRWIVYVADDGGGTIQLEIVNVATGESRALTSDAQIYMDPVFSPDGTRLAYVATKPNGNFNVFIRPIKDGQFAGDEIAVTRDNDFGRDRLYFGNMDMHITPAWLPGRQGAAAGLEPERAARLRQRAARAGGGERDRQGDDRPGGTDAVPHAAARLARRQALRLLVAPAAPPTSSTTCTCSRPSGGEPYKLTFFQHDAFHPRWSPDGEWIAFISNEGGLPQLQLLETYGGALRRIAVSERRWKRPMGVAVRADDRRGDATADGRAHSSHRVGRQALHAGGRLLARERRRRSRVPSDRERSGSRCRPGP